MLRSLRSAKRMPTAERPRGTRQAPHLSSLRFAEGGCCRHPLLHSSLLLSRVRACVGLRRRDRLTQIRFTVKG
jgi:hypothetical protein